MAIPGAPPGYFNFERNDFKLEGKGKKEELGMWLGDGRLAQPAGGSAPWREGKQECWGVLKQS